MRPLIVAVNASPSHTFSKTTHASIKLVADVGIQGDAHFRTTVQHLSRIAKDPSQPNLRQVHLIHEELLTELRTNCFTVEPGQLGENITTKGLSLLALSEGTRLKLGDIAVLRVTGLRNPCVQIDKFMPGLLAQVVSRNTSGELIRKAGVMCAVKQGGKVRAQDTIAVSQPKVHKPLQPV